MDMQRHARASRRWVLPILLLLAWLPGLALAAEDSPGELVKQRSQAIITALVEQREHFAAKPDALHAFVRESLDGVFDQEYSARLVLAQHSRGASQEEISAFAQALLDRLLERYGDALLEVDPGLSMKVTAETPLRGGAMMRVASEIERRGGAPVPVHYLFRKTDAGWKVFDVIVEGVSYVQTYRTQFGEQLRRKSLAQVTRDLREGRIDVAAN